MTVYNPAYRNLDEVQTFRIVRPRDARLSERRVMDALLCSGESFTISVEELRD